MTGDGRIMVNVDKTSRNLLLKEYRNVVPFHSIFYLLFQLQLPDFPWHKFSYVFRCLFINENKLLLQRDVKLDVNDRKKMEEEYISIRTNSRLKQVDTQVRFV